MRRFLLITLMVLSSAVVAYADGTKDDVENQYSYRFGADFQIKLAKGLKLNIEPELRFSEGFDNMMLNTGVSYKTFDFIYLGATYRMVMTRVEQTSSGISYSTSHKIELDHRYAFDITYKDDFGRFTPSFRIRYNNYTDEDIDDKEFLRYRGKVEYDIRKCKITPFVSVEAYQRMEDNMLYKVRYSTGFDYKISKSDAIGFDYKLDYFNLEYKNRHIFSVGYKTKF